MSARVELYREHPRVLVVGAVIRDEVSKWRWRFVSSNGRILADSGQGYVRRIDALTGCATVLGGRLNGDEVFRVERGREWVTAAAIIPVRDLTRQP